MRAAAALLSCAVAGTAAAADIRVLSAGAVEPGLVTLAEQFRRDTKNRVRIQFAAAPQLERRLASGGESPDVLVAPPGVMNDQLRRGKVGPEGIVPIGRVGVGVAARVSGLDPDISDLERFKRALLGADTLVYSQASTGLYIERLIDLLGMTDQLKVKTFRYASGAQVLEHLIRGGEGEIGFAPITEIRLFGPKGVRLVGLLPAQVQHSTAYSAAVMNDAPEIDVARDFVRLLGTPEAKAVFVAAGIE